MRKLVWFLSLAAMAVFPAGARADGIAFAGVENGGDGIASTDARTHYVTLKVGNATLVEKISADGSVLEYRTLPGAWGVPVVAFDGTAGGLSADGRVLVLAQPPIGRMRHVSRFPVVRTHKLRTARVVTLAGSFSFDALSPDGSTLYLIQHVNRRDVAEYQVRAYDLKRNRLLPYVIRDHESNEAEMYGYPMSRIMSADGRWAYTLYQGKHHSFVHALDTVARKAVCIDLPMDTPPEYIADAHLAVGPGGALTIDSRTGGLVAVIDTKKLELRRLTEEPPAAASPVRADETWVWVLVAIAFAVALAGATLRVRRLEPASAIPQGSLPNLQRGPRTRRPRLSATARATSRRSTLGQPKRGSVMR